MNSKNARSLIANANSLHREIHGLSLIDIIEDCLFASFPCFNLRTKKFKRVIRFILGEKKIVAKFHC